MSLKNCFLVDILNIHYIGYLYHGNGGVFFWAKICILGSDFRWVWENEFDEVGELGDVWGWVSGPEFYWRSAFCVW